MGVNMNYTVLSVLTAIVVLAMLATRLSGRRRVRLKNADVHFLGICRFRAESVDVGADEQHAVEKPDHSNFKK